MGGQGHSKKDNENMWEFGIVLNLESIKFAQNTGFGQKGKIKE